MSRFLRALPFLGVLLAASPAMAQTAIAELRAAPQRWINREVTVVGRVTAAAPNPAGTTRGFYTLLDDTDPAGVVVRSRDLPAIGREYVVRGVWILDPLTGVALVDETDRQDAEGRRAPVAAGGGGGGAAPSGLGLVTLLTLLAIVIAVVGAGALLLRSRSGSRPPAPTPTPAAAPLTPSGARVDVTLEVQTADGRSRRHRFRSAPILIGRSSGSDLVVDDPEVSRRHAEIRVEGGRLILVDLGSRHGTRVGEESVKRAEIRAGADIQLGATRIKVVG
jgi:hypothetical protein